MGSLDSNLVRVMNLLRQVPLIDGHNDLPYILRGWYGIDTSKPSFDVQHMPIGQTDLTRLATGGLGGQFWSAFVPCPKDDTEASALRVLKDTLQQIDLIHQLIELSPRKLAFAGDSSSVWQAFRSGRIASLIGVEGLHQIGGSCSALRLFHRTGVRYITLCHDCHNEFVDSSTPPTPLHGGLSKRGEDILREMNRTGIIIDLSHTSHDAQRHALRISKAPVIFSHSSWFVLPRSEITTEKDHDTEMKGIYSYTLQPHPRNVPDDVLEALKANNGVIMICFLPSLSCISRDGLQTLASVKTVAEHVMYVGKTIGYQHVGIGSDFDGMLEGPAGLDDVSAYPDLVAELLANGIDEEDVKVVLGLNILRVLDEVGHYAAQEQWLRATSDRMCDEVKGVWTDAQRAILAKKGAERGFVNSTN